VEAVLTMAHDVFISHAHQDKTVADAACAALEARGIRCWIAPRDIGPGQEWAAAIIPAIREAKIMVLVFSRHANESLQVRREVERAGHFGKVLLPLRIEDVMPGEALEFFLSTPHWLDAMTPPLEAHLDKLTDSCARELDMPLPEGQSVHRAPGPVGYPPRVGWWRRQGQAVKVALIAAVVVALAGVGVIAGNMMRPAPGHAPPPTAAPAPAAPPVAAPAPAMNPAPGGADPRAQIVQLTGSWSDQGFTDAIVNRDTSIVALYLKSGMKATTLQNGASAILYGFQGVPQNGDPVALVTTFQAGGFKVDDELQDSYLMRKLGQNPVPFNTPLTPKGYAGGEGGTFVGSLLFWITQRATWNGPNDQDMQVIKYLISQGADCKVPLSFFQSTSYLAGDYAYQHIVPLLQSCAK
jgi:hypothetical protein